MSGLGGQYRNPDITLNPDNFAPPKEDVNGRLVVTSDAGAPVIVEVGPADLTAFGRTTYRTAGPTRYENEAAVAAVSRVVELCYVQLGAVLVGAGPFYVLVVDTAVAIVAGDASAASMPVMTATPVAQMVVWEPPDGFLFTAGIRVIVSSTPNIYTAPAGAEPISVTVRTRDP